MRKFILLTLLFFSACKAIDIPSKDGEVVIPGVSSTGGEAIASLKEDILISSTGIGKAKLGMTIQELKDISEQGTEFELISSFVNDTNAIAVSKNDIIQYYILSSVDSNARPDQVTSTDQDTITSLMTNNNSFQTKEGIKVGTPIKEAEELYGNAILAHNIEGESQEYITFGKYNSENIKFRASYFKSISDGLGFSGIYSEYPGASYTTDKYHDNAAIAAIEVSCEIEDCY